MKLEEISHIYSTDDAQFLRAMGVMLGPGHEEGNKVDALLNGDQIFPSMLEAIRNAKKTITFETYIYWSDAVGHEFAEAFAKSAASGVKVHVLVDSLGSDRIYNKDIKMMRDAGVEFHKFNPIEWYHISHFNNRTHRKLLLVDGSIGFIGGVGIAQEWTGTAQNPDHWRDTHFRVEGPVVAQMQSVFMDNWLKATGEVLHSEEYFPSLKPVGKLTAQVFSSSPAGGSESMELMYSLAIASAESSIQLSNAYFIPDTLSIKTFVSALERGVKIQIITPGKHIDNAIVRNASRARWGELLKAGAEMYEYQPTMFHCKVMIVDEIFTTVGSTNFDPRSFRLNAEANLNIYDEEFAKKQLSVFQDDLAHSERLSYTDWKARPLTERIWDSIVSILDSEL